MHFIFIRPTRSFGSWRIYGLFSRLLSALACKPINSSKSIPDSLFFFVFFLSAQQKKCHVSTATIVVVIIGEIGVSLFMM